MAHLWEPEHPYYCNEGNYYTAQDVGETYDSWESFLEGFGDSDLDLNLVFRWDWKRADPEEEREHDTLLVFNMQQRKGKFCYAEVSNIREEDEPSVRLWLQARLDHLLRLWAPLSHSPAEVVSSV